MEITKHFCAKHFCDYSQAIALKELGFDKGCLGKYATLNGKDWEFYSESRFELYDETYDFGSNFSINAPLKSQAFEFFREKFKASPIITCHSEQGNCWKYHIPNEGGENNFYTYEEAENACIDKLIELTKKQNLC